MTTTTMTPSPDAIAAAMEKAKDERAAVLAALFVGFRNVTKRGAPIAAQPA
ncbi:MAG: hypothetical protein AAF684_11035 [Pseudomonadota bacterium]